MSRKSIFGLIATVFLMAALVYFYGGSQAPAGQPPLQSLTPENVAVIKNAFNAASNDVRMLLFLSPT
jgi:hypothetical protein